MYPTSFIRWTPPALDQAAAAAPPPPPTATPPTSAQRNAGTPGAPQHAMRQHLRTAWRQQQVAAHHTVHPAGMLDGALLGANCFFPITREEGMAPYRKDPADIPALQQKIARFNNAMQARENGFPKVHFHTPAYSPLSLPKATCLRIDGQFIDANYIHLSSGAKKLGREAVAIACAFPLRHQLKRHFDMIRRERPSVLVVLTESGELDEDRTEYFKHGGRFDDIEVHVAAGPAIAPPTPEGLAMQCYALSIDKEGEAAVSMPVIHVTNWKDGTAVKAEQMMPLVNMMRFTQAKDETAGPLGLPLVHCKAGVGRTAETLGAYLLAHDPDVKSAEGLIKDLKSSRGSWMAYVDDQQAELGRIAAMREMPVVAGSPMQASLHHLGYTGLAAREDDDFIEALDEISCMLDTVPLSLEQALQRLAGPDAGAIRDAMVLRVRRDGQAAHRMLWSAADDKLGLDAGDGELFRGTPLAFCERIAALPGAASTMVDIISISPSLIAGEVGIFTQRPGAKTQCDIAAYMAEKGIRKMSDIEDISDFLKAKDIEAFACDIDLSTDRDELIAALAHSRHMNVMLEYHSQSEGDNARCVLMSAQTGNAGGVDVLHYGEPTLNAPSLGDVVEHLWKECGGGEHTIVSVLSGGRIPGLEQRSNLAMDVGDADSEDEMRPA